MYKRKYGGLSKYDYPLKPEDFPSNSAWNKAANDWFLDKEKSEVKPTEPPILTQNYKEKIEYAIGYPFKKFGELFENASGLNPEKEKMLQETQDKNEIKREFEKIEIAKDYINHPEDKILQFANPINSFHYVAKAVEGTKNYINQETKNEDFTNMIYYFVTFQYHYALYYFFKIIIRNFIPYPQSVRDILPFVVFTEIVSGIILYKFPLSQYLIIPGVTKGIEYIKDHLKTLYEWYVKDAKNIIKKENKSKYQFRFKNKKLKQKGGYRYKKRIKFF